eukprot:1104590-Alexandrium_andersonii.AAC.1
MGRAGVAPAQPARDPRSRRNESPAAPARETTKGLTGAEGRACVPPPNPAHPPKGGLLSVSPEGA